MVRVQHPRPPVCPADEERRRRGEGERSRTDSPPLPLPPSPPRFLCLSVSPSLYLSFSLSLLGLAAVPATAETLARTDPAPVTAPPDRPSLADRRIVKHFDFEERPLGNFEALPMFWGVHVAQDFPRFLEGRFDVDIGHASPPSFRLQLNGGSIAYHYLERDIAVRGSSDYLVVAWLRTEGLDTARASFSAFFMDRKGNRIAGTERHSPLIGGSGALTDWQPVTVALPGQVPNARYMGLTVWLTQSDVWDPRPRPPHGIEREDVRGTCWFDDITVYRLPRVLLKTARDGNAFLHDQPVEILTEVNDPDGRKLIATLDVRDVDGRLVDHREVPIHLGEESRLDTVTYTDLPVGLYHARLIVETEDATLVHREARFVRLSPRVSPPAVVGRGFGVTLSTVTREALAGQTQLLDALNGQIIKLPAWRPGAPPDLQAGAHDAVDRYVDAIGDANGETVAIMADDPFRGTPAPARTAGSEGSLLDTLSQDPMEWRPMLAPTWSRYSGLIHYWQLGGDDDRAVMLDDRLQRALPALRREMETLIGRPLIAAPASARDTSVPLPTADYTSLHVPADFPADDLAKQVLPHLQPDPRRVWLTIEPLPEDRYPRLLRLADLGRRLAEARFLGVGAVGMRAPWDADADALSAHVSPNEDFIVLRTVADVLGGADPVSHITIDGQARGLLFDRSGRGILFVWDDHAPPEGYEHAVVLGDNAERVDLWGRKTPIASAGNSQRLRIGPEPTFIINVNTWLQEFRREFVLEPPIFEASYESSQQDIVFTNTYHETINGMLRLIGPKDWDIRPNRVPFVLGPGESQRQPISIRFPINAEAGLTPILGEFELDADRRYNLRLPVWFELGLDKIELETYVFRTGGQLVTRQSIINRSDQVVSFNGYLVASGQQPINRLFANVRPGRTMTKDFILPASNLAPGTRLRVSLREVRGPRFWNRVVTVP